MTLPDDMPTWMGVISEALPINEELQSNHDCHERDNQSATRMSPRNIQSQAVSPKHTNIYIHMYTHIQIKPADRIYKFACIYVIIMNKKL